MPQSNELRVFISSTFRDLQEEREHLVKKIFPEIRALCRQRGITFTEIDLRWGLTEEQSMLGTVIRTCLEEVDKCRPYFIGLIGNRYGWVPELHELMMDPDLLAKYPWIEDAAMLGASVTEMEFIHGVFDAPQVDGACAFFYHRQANISEADDPERLSGLIARTQATGHPFREFVSIDEFGRHVHDDLVGMIDLHWPESEVPSALELERRSHTAFAASRTRAYIPNPELLQSFSSWVSDGTAPLVIRGASGLGKSSLVAYLVEYYRRKYPRAFVIEHYVGASQSGGTSSAVVRHLVEEIRERFGIDEELPSRPEELEKSFANWLFRAEHRAMQAGIPLLIVVDAINQLDESGQRLGWLPKTIPAGLKLLVSTTEGEAGRWFDVRDWDSMEVRPLEDERVRQSIIVRYLGEFHKGIAPEQVRQIVSDPKARSPLYLRVVAEELRLHGEHETVAALIARYAQAEDLLDVFDIVLERLESDFGKEHVRALMELIWCSRSGLTEQELIELTGISRLDLSRLLFAIDYHFVHHQGALGFFHNYLRAAVEMRYIADVEGRARIRKLLAEHFEAVPLTARTAMELLWQYGSDDDSVTSSELDVRLASTLARPDVMAALASTRGYSEMLERWACLTKKGFRVGEEFGRSLADSAGTPDTIQSKALSTAASILQAIGEWESSSELYARLAAFGRDHEEPVQEAMGYLGLGEIRLLRGDYTDAMQHLQNSYRIASELGDRRQMAIAIGNIGVVDTAQGRYAEALDRHSQMLAICEELGDRQGMSRAIGHLGDVRAHQGKYAEAIDCFNRQFATSEEVGDRNGMSMAVGNKGVVYFHQGRYADALDCYQRQFAIVEELGNRIGMSNAIGNMGMVYGKQGRYAEALDSYGRCIPMMEEAGDRNGMSVGFGNMGIMHANMGEYVEALECFNRQRSICEEIGAPRGRSIAIGNMAWAYLELGQYESALECYTEAAGEHRRIGFMYGLSYWLEATARLLVALTETDRMPDYLPKHLSGAFEESWRALALAHARTCAEESVAISDDLGKPDTQVLARIALARIDAAEGRAESALKSLQSMLAEADGTERPRLSGQQRAELLFWMWRITNHWFEPAIAEVHRVEALQLYTDVYSTIPNDSYRQRIDELTTGITISETTNATE